MCWSRPAASRAANKPPEIECDQPARGARRTARAHIDRLKDQIPKREPDRDLDALYQFNQLIAMATGGRINLGNDLVTLDCVRSDGKLVASREVEYRNYILSCADLPAARTPGTVIGTFQDMAVGTIHCTIARSRYLTQRISRQTADGLFPIATVLL
jgi:hypothetical protein